MEQLEVERSIERLRKKHGDNFSLRLKYETNSGKVRKRSGEFVRLTADGTLILHNQAKGGEGRYDLAKIRELAKVS